MPDLSTLLVLGVIVFLAFVALLVIGLCAAAGREMPPAPQPTTRATSSNRKSGRSSR